jgi:hypothetical protein
MSKQHELNVSITSRQRVLVGGEAWQAGKSRKRGWFHRFLVGLEPQRGHPGKFAFKIWLMKRVGFGDRYRETVIDEETGKLLRHCDHPLSQHKEHGSAKQRK